MLSELGDEEKEDMLAGARWKAERKEGHQTRSIQGVA